MHQVWVLIYLEQRSHCCSFWGPLVHPHFAVCAADSACDRLRMLGQPSERYAWPDSASGGWGGETRDQLKSDDKTVCDAKIRPEKDFFWCHWSFTWACVVFCVSKEQSYHLHHVPRANCIEQTCPRLVMAEPQSYRQRRCLLLLSFHSFI